MLERAALILCCLFLQLLSCQFALAAPAPGPGPSANEPTPSPMVDAIKLEQQSVTHGPVTTTIAPEAFRVDIKRSHLTAVSAAPNWDVYLFSDARKVYWHASHAVFLDKGFESLFAGSGSKHPPNVPVKTSLTIFGVPCEKIRWESSKNKGIMPSLYGIYYGKKVQSVKAYYEVQQLTQKVPPQLAENLCGVLNLAITGGVQLNAFDDVKDSNGPTLKTSSLSKTKVSKSIFTCPPGYKSVKTANEMLMTASSKQAVEDSFGSLWGDKPGK